MKINEALILVDRIRNLPEFYDNVEAAVCGVIHRYYNELYEIGKIEAEIVSEVGFDDERLDSLLQKKVDIHDKFWTNSSSFYKPVTPTNNML
ncbi:hypothetical protein HHX48_11840 [Salinimonas sp. HHU 13199]|uniref:Uncharacterized protein n=1 Tax=Salinimonas profundi TaxID=2729140 RepID=A0ABR8LQP4_9ALTE|nr:hypothetical protein [Salinimonas profundi]MBD3586430.1 hypothetical protein [Salinimonas profundi]